MTMRSARSLAATAAFVAFAAGGSAFCPASLGHVALKARARAFLALQAEYGSENRGAARAARAAAARAGGAKPPASAVPPAPPQQARGPPQQAGRPPLQAGGPASLPPPDSGAGGAAAAAAADARDRGIHQSKVQMDDGLAEVLTEFCLSRYAKAACEYCNASPMDFGNIWGMFSSVVRRGDVLVIKLNSNFESRSKQTLDQLSKHLRARMPELRLLQYEKKFPPSTENIMLAAVLPRVAERHRPR